MKVKINTAKVKYRIYQLETTQKQISESIETTEGNYMTQAAFSDLINNKSDAKLSSIGKLAEALKMEPQDIIIKVEEKEKQDD